MFKLEFMSTFGMCMLLARVVTSWAVEQTCVTCAPFLLVKIQNSVPLVRGCSLWRLWEEDEERDNDSETNETTRDGAHNAPK